MTSQEKTFEAIAKLQEIELELHRLRNALDRANKALDAQHIWVGLTDEELLQAYGWKLAQGAPNWLLEEAKQELLGALRKVEASIKEKNNGKAE